MDLYHVNAVRAGSGTSEVLSGERARRSLVVTEAESQ